MGYTLRRKPTTRQHAGEYHYASFHCTSPVMEIRPRFVLMQPIAGCRNTTDPGEPTLGKIIHS
jgi:hypothetical protein